MSTFVKTVFISSLIGLCIVIGCDKSTSSKPTAISAIGTWKGTVSDSTMIMVVKSDSTFETTLPNINGTYDVTGTYKLNGNTITLSYASGLQGTEGIPPPNTPVNGTISGTKMTIPIPYDTTGDSTTLKKQ